MIFPEKPAPAAHPIHDLLGRRWSPRALDPDRPVARETLLRLLEAARWAPSSGNEQPWRFLVFDESTPEARDAARACLTPGNQPWAGHAPVLVLTVACQRWSRKGQEPNPHAEHDVGLATENFLLQGIIEGLVLHPMAGFDAGRAREAFAIPEACDPLVMIAVGHPGDPALLPEKLRDREAAPRARKPLGELAFAGVWGSGIAES